MRTLNRPMFRYGGPIKQGIMSGIREPKRNGGSMREAQQWNTVGSSVFPKDSSGRAHHWLPAAGYAARLLPWAARGAKAAWRYMKPTSVPRNIVTKTDQGSKLPIGMRGSIKDRINITPRSNFQMAKNWMRANPGWTATGILSGYNAPSTYEGIKGAGGIGGTVLKQIADLAVPDWIWDQDKWEKERALKKTLSGVEDKITQSGVGTSGAPGGGDPGMYLKPQTKKGGGVELTPEELRKKNVQRYRDIMDIKGMNKEAAYDSLIAASQAINETGGDFKQSIKDGSLINRIIQDTSKAFDKPQKTKDAIDTLILKGEIEKDIKASDPNTILDAKYKRAKIAESEKALNPSYNTLKASYAKANVKGQSGIDGAANEYSKNNDQVFRGNIISKSDFKEKLEDIKKESGGVDEISIIENWTNEVIKDKNVPDGNYTVGDKIVTIQDSVVVAVE